MFLSRTRHSDSGEAQTHGPYVSSQALYHYATALPTHVEMKSVQYLHTVCFMHGLSSDSFTILGLWVLGLTVSHIN